MDDTNSLKSEFEETLFKYNSASVGISVGTFVMSIYRVESCIAAATANDAIIDIHKNIADLLEVMNSNETLRLTSEKRLAELAPQIDDDEFFQEAHERTLLVAMA